MSALNIYGEWDTYDRDPAQRVECSACHQQFPRVRAYRLAVTFVREGVVQREDVTFACSPACRDALAARYAATARLRARRRAIREIEGIH